MKPNSISDLIAKILTNSADKSEQEYFENWLRESEEHEILFQKAKTIWGKIDNSYKDLNFDKARARKRIALKLQEQAAKTKKLRTLYWYSAAASILILLGIGYLLFPNMTNRESTLISYHTDAGSIKEIVLPDSSHVWLNENTSLRFANSYNRSQRKVFLEGEAYFNVKKDTKRPFKVQTGNTITKVSGTSFNLKLNSKGNVCLIVSSGKVQFYKKNSLIRASFYTAGQKGEMSSSNLRIKNMVNEDKNYLSWKTGELIFNNTSIAEVCEILSHHYKISIESLINDPSLSLTGTFLNEELEEILTTIELTLDVKSINTGDGVQLQKMD